jgi:glucokinase
MRSWRESLFHPIKNRASGAILNGNPATSRITNWQMAHFAGIEIGGTKLQLVLGDEEANIIERRKFAVEPGKGAAGIRGQIEQGISELIGIHKPEAIGVGFGGPVDWKAGVICRSHQIEGWSGFDLGKWLRELTGARVFVDNDANLAALGEAKPGAGVGLNPVFYVTLGSGVGGGLVVNGSIYHGAAPGKRKSGMYVWIATARQWNRTALAGRWMQKYAN